MVLTGYAWVVFEGGVFSTKCVFKKSDSFEAVLQNVLLKTSNVKNSVSMVLFYNLGSAHRTLRKW